MNVTINEIAKLAQVSKGTVSKALNGYPGVSPETKKKILDIVAQMGFEPNSAAQALALKKTGSIGLVIPHSPANSLNGFFWSAMVSATAMVATRAGFNLMLLMPHEEGMIDNLITTIIRKKQVDGLIIGGELIDTSHLAALVHYKLPFVMVGRNSRFQHYCVDIDHIRAAEELTAHLVSQGYRRIAFLAGPQEFDHNRERVAGYRRAIAAAGLDWSYSSYEPYNQALHHQESIDRLFALREVPDAVITGAGGEFMLDCLEGMQRHGYAPPRVGFATFDDYQFLNFLSPAITAVRQPMDELGAEAFAMLQVLMQDETPDTLVRTLSTSLIVRASSMRGPGGSRG